MVYDGVRSIVPTVADLIVEAMMIVEVKALESICTDTQSAAV